VTSGESLTAPAAHCLIRSLFAPVQRRSKIKLDLVVQPRPSRPSIKAATHLCASGSVSANGIKTAIRRSLPSGWALATLVRRTAPQDPTKKARRFILTLAFRIESGDSDN